MDFLEDLYLNGYHPIEQSTPKTAALLQAKKELAVYEEQTISAMGSLFFDKYLTAQNRVLAIELAYAHAQGVRFALNLLLNPLVKEDE